MKGELIQRNKSYSKNYDFKKLKLFKRQNETDIFHHLVHSPNGHDIQSWARQKIEEVLFGFPMLLLPGAFAGSWIGSGTARTQTGTCMGHHHYR